MGATLTVCDIERPNISGRQESFGSIAKELAAGRRAIVNVDWRRDAMSRSSYRRHRGRMPDPFLEGDGPAPDGHSNR